MKKHGAFRLRLVIGLLSLAVLVLSLGFTVLLTVSTLKTKVVESSLSGYRGAGEHFALGIERGVRFGKPLGQFAGMTEMMEGLRDSLAGLAEVTVMDAAGTALYTLTSGSEKAAGTDDAATAADGIVRTAGHPQEAAAPRTSASEFDKSVLGDAEEAATKHLETADRYHIVIPLYRERGHAADPARQSPAGEVIGGLALDISRAVVDTATQAFVRWATVLLLACCLVASVLPALIGPLGASPATGAESHRKLGKMLLLFVGGTQLAYTCATLYLFDSFMEQAVRTKGGIIAQSVRGDFEYLVHKGVDATALKGNDALLQALVDRHTEIRGAALTSPDGTPLVRAGATDSSIVVETSVDAYWPSRYRQRQEMMRIRLAMDPEAVAGPMRTLTMDLATVLVISLLFLFELAKLLELVLHRMQRAMAETAQAEPGPSLVASVLRACGFLFFLGYDMGISFTPLLARSLYEPLWGLSEEVLMGLPISAEMVCAGAALLLAGIVCTRFGWRWAFAIGVGCASLGLFTAYQATGLPGFILARGIAGFGFGMALMTVQIGMLGERDAGSGIAGVFAGIFSGSICGSAGGAMLAERVGYKAVFMVAALLVLLAVLALPLAGRKGSAKDGRAGPPEPRDASFAGGWAFLRDPRMHCLLLCIGLPAALCLTGFLYYLLPVTLNNARVSQSDIGRIFMLYGLCFITVGPLLGRWTDRARDKSLPAALTGLLSGVTLLFAVALPSVVWAGMAVVTIGLAQCLAAPATMLCVIGLGSAERLGKEKAASLYRALERIGQVLGPILFGTVLVTLGTTGALIALGAALCGFSLLFWLLWRISSSPRD